MRMDWSNTASTARAVRGFHAGTGDWRWTAPTFAVRLDLPSGPPPHVEMDFSYPEELARTHPVVTVNVAVNGKPACAPQFKEGRHSLDCELPAGINSGSPLEIEFQTSPAQRHPDLKFEAGLIVVSVQVTPADQTLAARERQASAAREAYGKVLAKYHSEVPAPMAREMQALFHKLPVWDSLSFQNTRIIKNPLDLWMVQQLIYETKPDVIVETGTWQGGSALYWAFVLNGMGLTGSRVITVDIQDLPKPAANTELWKKHVQFLLGSSTDKKIVARIADQVKDRRTLVMLDSDHSRTHVLAELQAYAPMVSKGSYLIVEDTHLDGIPTHPEQGPGPTAAVNEFLATEAGKTFEQDFSREALLMTFNPGGWLRRK